MEECTAESYTTQTPAMRKINIVNLFSYLTQAGVFLWTLRGLCVGRKNIEMVILQCKVQPTNSWAKMDERKKRDNDNIISHATAQGMSPYVLV